MSLSIRLRRVLRLSSSLLRDRHLSSISSSPPPLSAPKPCSPLVGNPSPRLHSLIQAQSFRSSAASHRDIRFDDQPISENDILFEGCDYNHWLITIDFPRQNPPPREEMIETYVQTAAKVFGSVEEAKKRIYACSTTTYQGFQVLCDEATSKKFEGLPGVVFILPDSYIDPINKEYGGDKYENGVITPRPPPIQYGRQGRYGDRNRNYDQPRYNRPSDSSPPQDGRGFGPPPQDRRGSGPPPQEGRGFGTPPQDGKGFGPPPLAEWDSQGRYGPRQLDGRRFGPPSQSGRDFGSGPQDGRGFVPPAQDGRGFGPGPQDGRGFVPPAQDGRGFGPPAQDGRNFGPPPQEGRGYGPPPQEGRGYGQGEQRGQMPPYQSGFQQGPQVPPRDQRNFSEGPGYVGDRRQGSSFDREPTAGPAEGQWQAKY